MNKDLQNFTDLDPQLEEILNNFSVLFDIRIGYFLPDGSEFKIGKQSQNFRLLLHSQRTTWV